MNQTHFPWDRGGEIKLYSIRVPVGFGGLLVNLETYVTKANFLLSQWFSIFLDSGPPC